MKTIIIAGVTRSGLTLTMQMLQAGGYPCLGSYPAFEDDEVMNVDFTKTKGVAIKQVDIQHKFPPKGEYHVIRLRRNHQQQAKSITKFLRMLQMPVTSSDTKAFEKSLQPDYQKIHDWSSRQKGYLVLNFEDLINDPLGQAKLIADFTGEQLDIAKMAKVVIPRKTDCLEEMLEVSMLPPPTIIQEHPFVIWSNDLLFKDSPDSGYPECTCSRCGTPIMDFAYRAWPGENGIMDNTEYRFGATCIGLSKTEH